MRYITGVLNLGFGTGQRFEVRGDWRNVKAVLRGVDSGPINAHSSYVAYLQPLSNSGVSFLFINY